MSSPAKLRLDELLVARGLAPTRAQAKALIMSGRVLRGTERLDKPGKEFPEDLDVTVEQPPRFVSRGGEKLEGALDHFKIPVEGLHGLDVGASTGGFTDCALQAGAASATCVDVGHSQLHDRIRRDPRVTNLEKTNARHLAPGMLRRLCTRNLDFFLSRPIYQSQGRRDGHQKRARTHSSCPGSGKPSHPP